MKDKKLLHETFGKLKDLLQMVNLHKFGHVHAHSKSEVLESTKFIQEAVKTKIDKG